MKKKVVSMLLASTLILSAMLTGCGNAPAIAIRAATARVPPRW